MPFSSFFCHALAHIICGDTGLSLPLLVCICLENTLYDVRVLFVLFRALRRFQQSFSHIAAVIGCGWELNVHF